MCYFNFSPIYSSHDKIETLLYKVGEINIFCHVTYKLAEYLEKLFELANISFVRLIPVHIFML